MDLDEMKTTWSEMDKGLKMTEEPDEVEILKIIQKKSVSSLNRIMYAEGIGSVITLIGIGYIIGNFGKLQNWLDITAGIGTVVILIIAAICGFLIFITGAKIDVINDSSEAIVRKFEAFKKLLNSYKKLTIVIYIIMPFLIIPLFTALTLEKSLLDDLEKFGEGIIASFVILPAIWLLIFWFYRRNIDRISQFVKKIKD
ncbi:MAG: hypothetical protein NXI20_08745 [bacterium]|nr:hypothetical protein [bacterium]